MSIIKVKTGGITADAITDALIADDVVGTEHLTANEVDTTALGADAVTGAQLADDAVNSEHYTDGSVDTAHIADANVTQGKIADQAINEAKMQISNAPTNGYALTAQSGNTGGLTWAEIGGGSWVKISTVTASSSSSVDFDNVANTYKVYAVIGAGIRPATDGAAFNMNFGSDGNTYAASKTSAFVHQYNKNNDTDLQNETNGTNSLGSGTGDQQLGYGLSDNVAMSGSNTLNAIFGGLGIGNYSSYDVKFTHFGSNSYMYSSTVRGIIAADVDCIRFIMSSGNIAAGTFTLYGIDQ